MRSEFHLLLAIALLSAPLHAGGPAQESKTPKTKHGQTTQEAPLFRIFNPDTLAKPIAAYSEVAEVHGGKIVYIAGQVALDRSGKLVGKDDFRAQVQQVFENLKAAVEATGGNFNNVIKLNL